MSYKILTPCVASIDTFIHDPHSILNNAERGIVAIFINNVPAFYVVSSQRLAQFLELEMRIIRSTKKINIDNQLYKGELLHSARNIPTGKFNMYYGWKPDKDFQKMATLWGVSLTQPVMSEELITFISYWKAKRNVFRHIQWQQKLARSIQISRANNRRWLKSNNIIISEPNNKIPSGFRG